MSSFLFISAANNIFSCPGVGMINDDQLSPPDFRYFVDYGAPVLSSGDCGGPDMSWPRSHTFGGGPASLGSGLRTTDGMSYLWELDCFWTGGHRRAVVAGIVYDSGGSPVAGASVYLFNSATSLLVDSGVSAADGSYKLGDPNSTTNFVLATASGPVEGATINTLTGS